jgi:hypothetical protein
MKRFLAIAVGAAAILLVASAAIAQTFYKYPPGPTGTCTDTLTLYQLKDAVLNAHGTCQPQVGVAAGAPGDTVLGVGGIIIGFDEIPTGFDIYVQTTGGGPLTGIDVFTHGTNFRPLYGFQLGDSVVVEWARVANYYGDVELEAPNNTFSNPDIVLRLVSSGNPLPPLFEGNTTDFVETPTNTYIKPYMTCLVKLNGPVRVARVGAPNGDTKLGTRGMLVVRDAAPSDSVFIDYAKLTAIVPPTVGTYLTSISGIVNSASRGWRIMPRGATDIVDVVPPSVTDAYAVADDQYRIVFDRAVTSATATVIGNYSLASFGTVNTAVMDGTDAVILGVSGTGLTHGRSETVEVNGITGLANGITMTTPVHATFLAGVLSCGEMSAPNPDSLAAVPCRDLSRYAGTGGQYLNGAFGPRSTMTGIVVGKYGNLYYMEDNDPAHNRGITVFAPPVALTLGHRYLIAGAAEEYYSENEFAAITYVRDDGAATVPAAVPLTVRVAALDTCDAAQNITSGRDYLSDLVKLTNVDVVQRPSDPAPTTGFYVVQSSDTIFVENQNKVLGDFVVGNPNYPAAGRMVDVVGVMHYTTNTSYPSFRVCPRNAADITDKGPAGVGTTPPAALTFSVFPNPARRVNVNFTLPHAADVQLGVYDISGRRVALVASGNLPAGSYQKAWDGLGDNGSRVQAGVYFYRLRAGSEVRTATAVLLGN